MKLLTLLPLILASGVLAFAHGGGLDGSGCHNDRQRGGYHCHRGPLAGRSFSSSAEAARALSQPAAAPAATVVRTAVATPPQAAPQTISELQAAVAELRTEVARLNRVVQDLTLKLAEHEGPQR